MSNPSESISLNSHSHQHHLFLPSATVSGPSVSMGICGSPEFMEKLEAQQHEQAFDKDSCCGFHLVVSLVGFIIFLLSFGCSIPLLDRHLSWESEKRIVGNFTTHESADSWRHRCLATSIVGEISPQNPTT